MNDAKFITYSRGSFALLRWAPFAGLATLPFTFSNGPISAGIAVVSVPIAAAWLGSLLLAWRTRRESWFALGFVALVFGPRLAGLLSSEISPSQFIQWFCLVIILTGIPLLFFRARLLHFARLNEPNVAESLRAAPRVTPAAPPPSPAQPSRNLRRR